MTFCKGNIFIYIKDTSTNAEFEEVSVQSNIQVSLITLNFVERHSLSQNGKHASNFRKLPTELNIFMRRGKSKQTILKDLKPVNRLMLNCLTLLNMYLVFPANLCFFLNVRVRPHLSELFRTAP